MSDEATMTEPEIRGRIALLEQVVTRLMGIISLTATPDMLDALNKVDNQWIEQLKPYQGEKT
jgi:hypothetical protein